jgi:hypothetical protein
MAKLVDTSLWVDFTRSRSPLHHNAELVTFDADFERIAAVSSLRLTRLVRPSI